MVIPFENSIFYVEPVYITSQNNASLPEVKRIIVAYKDAVAMAPTLEEALSQVLKDSDGLNGGNLTEGTGTTAGGTDAASPEGTTGQTPEQNAPIDQGEAQEKIQKVLDAYDAFKSSSGQNDWNKMGQDLDNLDKAIDDLR